MHVWTEGEQCICDHGEVLNYMPNKFDDIIISNVKIKTFVQYSIIRGGVYRAITKTKGTQPK